MKQTKLIALFLALVLMLGIAACGQKSEPAKQDAPAATAAPAPAATKAPEAPKTETPAPAAEPTPEPAPAPYTVTDTQGNTVTLENDNCPVIIRLIIFRIYCAENTLN